MADEKVCPPTPKTASNTRSLLTLGVVGVILLFLLDQGRIMRRIFGPLAQLVGLTFEEAAKLVREAGATADDWVRESWSRIKSLTYWLVMAAFAAFIVAFTLEAKGYGGAGTVSAIIGGVILVVTLTIWEVAIPLTLMAVMLGVHLADDTLATLRRKLGLAAPPSQPMAREDVEKALEAVKRTSIGWIAYLRLGVLGITAFVITFSLSWTGLGLAIGFAFMGWVIDSFRSRADRPSKTGLLVVAMIFTAAVALKFVWFLVLLKFPELSAYHRLPIDEWLAQMSPGPLGWLAILAAVPVTLLIVSGFDMKRGYGWRNAATAAAVVAALIALLLWKRGVLTKETLGFQETPEASAEGEAQADPLSAPYKHGSSGGSDDIMPPPLDPPSPSGDGDDSEDPISYHPSQPVRVQPVPRPHTPPPVLAPTPYKTPGEAGLDLLGARKN